MLCFAQTYKVTDLGTLGGTESIATAINASGEITGGSTNASNVYHAFLYSNGTMTDLGTLGGPSSQGQGINTTGEIAGYAQLPPSTSAGYPPRPVSFYSAFYTVSGKETAIGQSGGVAYAINDSGQIVAVEPAGAVLYTKGMGTNLGNLGSSSGTEATGINSLGEVVGYSYLTNGNFRGFYWISGKMTEMGTFGGDWSQAYAVNDAGQITGTAYTTSNLANHAFLYTSSTMKDLGTLSGGTISVGTAVNLSGTVVGYAQAGSSSETLVYHAFVYTGSKMQDLNSLIPAKSGWVLSQANGINASGEIVGYGTINGLEHAFLLTPVK
jgi:probable HAF family extracellular repeat protein